jgi:hypothetical protein
MMATRGASTRVGRPDAAATQWILGGGKLVEKRGGNRAQELSSKNEAKRHH